MESAEFLAAGAGKDSFRILEAQDGRKLYEVRVSLTTPGPSLIQSSTGQGRKGLPGELSV